MADPDTQRLRAFVFKNRGLLLALPAAALVAFGKPNALGIALGLPIAFAGELLRCWAVGYSGVTTRHDSVTAPMLVSAGPYGYVRNPLYLGNFITAAGFAVAFTGGNTAGARGALVFGSLAAMLAIYSVIVPHEEAFLRDRFGEAFDRYCERVPRLFPQSEPVPDGQGTWNGAVVATAERHTFAVFGIMLALLAVRALRS